jgi:hypothetical protein
VVLLAIGGGYCYLTTGWPWLYGTEAYLYGFPLIMMDLTEGCGDSGVHRYQTGRGRRPTGPRALAMPRTR